ncbi:glycosyltransferase [Coleofasciculus sp. FACHB-T130]|uniref:glycosyltransferase n=1 Tax=Cyanophyceae TaxID=3028117 RepID=UPI0016897CF1|nr:glycosyltransferase [Coleofasciculus sp. FACHB-T130]MBD1879737.1 glycosyltransferase [Coleofasciculus sp. FACHB-T130]
MVESRKDIKNNPTLPGLPPLLRVPSESLQIAELGLPTALAGSKNFEKLGEERGYAHTRPLRFSLVVPTYNEGDNIREIVRLLTQLLDGAIPNDYELIVVDDNSPDGTWEIAQVLMLEYPHLRVMRRIEERGLSTAVIRGWQAARGEILGVIDADLQHPPELLLQLLAKMDRGADLAAASRHVEGGGVSDWSIVRRFLSRGAQMLGLILLPGVVGRVSDPMSGYFLVRRECLVGKTLSPVGYKILIEVLGRGDIRWIAEAGYVFQERQAGESKVSAKQYVDYLRHLLRLRLSRWPIGRFLRFGAVGFSGVFVDMAVFYLLRTQVGLGLTSSAALASELAIINNFLWNDSWTFADISSRQQGWNKRFKRLLKFNLVCLSGLVLNLLILNLLFNVLGVNQYVAKLIAIAAVTLWNFWINLKLSWRVTETK